MKKRFILPFTLFAVSVLFAGFSTGQGFDHSHYAYVSSKPTPLNEISEVLKANRLEVAGANVKVVVADDLLSDSHVGDGDVIIYANNGDENFQIEEFLRYDPNPTAETIRKIKTVHIPELEKVRSRVGEPIIIRSASRTYEHEKRRGRSGNSQHIFPKGLGAVDISLLDYSTDNLNRLEEALISQSTYTRISRYKSYLHADFGENRFGGRAYYTNTAYGWIYSGQLR